LVINVKRYRRIRDLREDADLTQRQVGEAINVPQRTYAYYESGERMLPPHVLCALADFYGVSVDYLLERTDKKNEKTHTHTGRRARLCCDVTRPPWQASARSYKSKVDRN